MGTLNTVAALLRSLMFISCFTAQISLAQTVTVSSATIQGTTTSIAAASAVVSQYLGVPFAVSPPQRFSPATPNNLQGRYAAKTYKPACIQAFPYTSAMERQYIQEVFDTPVPQESEDCLYLNIFVPSSSPPNGGFPVMFWIYGGSNQFGNAGQPTYHGDYLAAYEDVIVVTANYRTNVFGFPASPELPLTGLNLGLLDQRLALQWVQKHIAAFGGSPNKVTIFGESAGAEDIDALLTSYGASATPPFRAAILESGQISYRPFQFGNNTPAWNMLSSALNCPGSYKSDLACVRAASVTDIKTAINQNGLTFAPIADGVTLVTNPAYQRMNKKIAPVPVMGGTNAQEGRVFVAASGANNSSQLFDLLFGPLAANNTFIELLIDTLELVTGPITSATADAYAQVITDFIFTCPCKDWAGAYAQYEPAVPAWRYYFNASFPNTQPTVNKVKQDLGVYHSSEIPIVFGTFPAQGSTAQERALSRSMMTAWANFAKNPSAGPGWNPVKTQDDETLAIFGNIGGVASSSYHTTGSSSIDQNCGLYEWIYAAVNAASGQ